jgi:hypothetical protein
MTKFEELQQVHQSLMDRVDEVADKAAFAREAQVYVTRVCEEAVDVSAPRDRDQLRANLRYWASYLYDATGTYPNTTLRPARPAPAASAPPPAAATFNWRTGLAVAIVLLMLGVMFLWTRSNQPTAAPSSAAATVQPEAAASGQALSLSWRVITAGPSPFNPAVWVARIELSATGGNGEYIFWANGQRLPETSNNEFTVESQGCQPISQFIGVTSGGQSTRQELVIQPPEPNSCAK